MSSSTQKRKIAESAAGDLPAEDTNVEEMGETFMENIRQAARKKIRSSTKPPDENEAYSEAIIHARQHFEWDLNMKQTNYLAAHYSDLRAIDDARHDEIEMMLKEKGFSKKDIEAYVEKSQCEYITKLHKGVKASEPGRIGYPKWEDLESEAAWNIVEPLLLGTAESKAKIGHQEWLTEMKAHKHMTIEDPKQAVLNYTTHQVKVALEIIRRVKPDDPMKALYVDEKYPRLEYDSFSGASHVTHPNFRKVYKAYKGGELLKITEVLPILRTWLLFEREKVISALRLHYTVKQDDFAGNMMYIQECVYYFDRTFTHHISKVTGMNFRVAIMKLGVTQDVGAFARFGLDVGLPHKKGVLEHNERILEVVKADNKNL